MFEDEVAMESVCLRSLLEDQGYGTKGTVNFCPVSASNWDRARSRQRSLQGCPHPYLHVLSPTVSFDPVELKTVTGSIRTQDFCPQCGHVSFGILGGGNKTFISIQESSNVTLGFMLGI